MNVSVGIVTILDFLVTYFTSTDGWSKTWKIVWKEWSCLGDRNNIADPSWISNSICE